MDAPAKPPRKPWHHDPFVLGGTVVALVALIGFGVAAQQRWSGATKPTTKAPKQVAKVGRPKEPATQEQVRTDDAKHIAAADAKIAKAQSAIEAEISGAAFLSMSNGTSQILRGLEIHLLPATVRKAAITEALRGILKENTYQAKQIEPFAKARRSELAIATFAAYQEAVKSTERLLSLSDDAELDMCDVYNVAYPKVEGRRYVRKMSETTHWSDAARPQIVKTTNTSVDGKYTMSVHGGRYLLFARFSTQRQIVDWLIPIDIEKSGPISQDLYSGNAITIAN